MAWRRRQRQCRAAIGPWRKCLVADEAHFLDVLPLDDCQHFVDGLVTRVRIGAKMELGAKERATPTGSPLIVLSFESP
jgi:hypothetical protein